MASERAALLAALALQRDFGADEALEDRPIDRTSLAPVQEALRQSAVASLPRAPATPTNARSGSTNGAEPVPSSGAGPVPSHDAPASAATAGVPPVAARAMALAAAADSLDALRDAIAAFDGSALRDTATRMVFGEGAVGAPLLLVGDVPGPDEDRVGRPFVGPPGQLLDRMLRSIEVDRASQCYSLNVLPWRPPGDRPPTAAEIAMFLPFARRQIALVAPRRLLLLGVLAVQALTGSTERPQRLRGRWSQVTISDSKSVPALATLHPGHLLRVPSLKRDAWSDLLLLRRSLDAN